MRSTVFIKDVKDVGAPCVLVNVPCGPVCNSIANAAVALTLLESVAITV